MIGGGPDWIDRVDVPDGIGSQSGETRCAERQRRISLVNHILAPSGVRLREFGGKLVVRGGTGRTRIVNDLAHVWLAVEQVGCLVPDPLNDDWLRRNR